LAFESAPKLLFLTSTKLPIWARGPSSAPDDGIAPGTLWADVPMNWVCPECGARKEDFELVQI
jgi:hypothetical protein